MKVECPECKAVCRVDASKVPEKGIFGKCPKCQHRFLVKKEDGLQGPTPERQKKTVCPRCHHERAPEDIKCPKCGIIYDKFREIYSSQNRDTSSVKKRLPTVMIVEDEISVSMELEEMLTENGYDVGGVVDSGEDAISMARSLRPDLILMDIKLSGELDGIEAATKIRSSLNITSVFLTGYGENELLERAVKARPLGYIMKPLNTVQILAALKVALHEKASANSSN